MTIKELYFYRDAGDHIAFRNASMHVVDNRDKRGLDGKPIYDSNGVPLFVGDEPPWVSPAHFLKVVPTERLPDEIEFDHVPNAHELSQAFPSYMKYQILAQRMAAKREAERLAAEQAQKNEVAAELAKIEAGLKG